MYSIVLLIAVGGGADVPAHGPPVISHGAPDCYGAGYYGPPPQYYGQTWTYGALNPYYIMGYPDFFHKIGHFPLGGHGINAYGYGMPLIYPQAPPRPFVPLGANSELENKDADEDDGDEKGDDGDEPDPSEKKTPEKKEPEKPVAPIAPAKGTMNVPQDRAAVVVKLPADAALFVNGRRTSQSSAERQFQTPTLQPGQTYLYTLEAEYQREGRSVVSHREIRVTAGRVTTVEFEDQGVTALVRREK